MGLEPLQDTSQVLVYIITISSPKNEQQKYINLHVFRATADFMEECCIKVVTDSQNYFSIKVVLFRLFPAPPAKSPFYNLCSNARGITYLVIKLYTSWKLCPPSHD
jgi:hypothetical protein